MPLRSDVQEAKMIKTHKKCSNKNCEKSGRKQLIKNFCSNKSSKDGFSSWCKICRRSTEDREERPDTAMYKIGAHGLVYMLIGGEWLRSTMSATDYSRTFAAA